LEDHPLRRSLQRKHFQERTLFRILESPPTNMGPWLLLPRTPDLDAGRIALKLVRRRKDRRWDILDSFFSLHNTASDLNLTIAGRRLF
jgi:hypothetical protein